MVESEDGRGEKMVVMVMAGMAKGEERERRKKGKKGRGGERVLKVTAHAAGCKGFGEG